MTGGVNAMTMMFVALAVTVNLLALGIGVLLVGNATGSARARAVLFETIAPWARGLAVTIGATATFGSLFYSEAAGFAPCQLCWYQRFCMYPIAAVLAIGWWRPARISTRWVAFGLAVIGSAIALYHWLVERVPTLAETTACSVKTPCSVPWFTRLGFVTIAWMAFSGFVAIVLLLICEWRNDRAAEPTSATAPARMSEPRL
jgi:disulfide bond formation protein DsbB